MFCATLLVQLTNALGANLQVPSRDYPTIQAAMNGVSAGNTVRLATGTYYENVGLSAVVALAGSGRDVAIIDGGGALRCEGDDLTMVGNIIRDNGLFATGGDFVVASTLSADPLLTDWWNGDFQLLPGSPCIDAGLSDVLPAYLTSDFYGRQRVVGQAVDIGVAEFPLPALDFSVRSAAAKFFRNGEGRVAMWSDLDLPRVAPTDVLSLDFEGYCARLKIIRRNLCCSLWAEGEACGTPRLAYFHRTRHSCGGGRPAL